jgi:hypothetical protein
LQQANKVTLDFLLGNQFAESVLWFEIVSFNAVLLLLISVIVGVYSLFNDDFSVSQTM